MLYFGGNYIGEKSRDFFFVQWNVIILTSGYFLIMKVGLCIENWQIRSTDKVDQELCGLIPEKGLFVNFGNH